MNSLTMASWMNDNWWLEIVLVLVAIIIEIALICNRTLARAVPYNYIALLVFTLCESYMVAFICMYYVYEPFATRQYPDPDGHFNEDGYRTVGIALAFTLCIVAACTAYAWTTKVDFTMKWGFIWIFGMTFFMLSFFSIFFYSYFFHMFLCAIGTMLFGIYLIFDT